MSTQYGNLGVVKDKLQLYYNREWLKSFRGEATTNLVSADYDNFENTVGSYNAVNNTATRTNEIFYFGNYSLKIVRSSSGADGYADMEGYINVSPSTTYTYSVYVYTATITQSINILRPVYFTSANVYISEGSGGNITSSDVGKWKRVSYTFTTPSNCAKIVARLNVESSSYYPLIYYIDGRQLEQKSYATPFVTNARTANTVAGGGGLLDISGNNYSADLNSAAVAFDSGGFYFNADAAGALTTPVANSVLNSLSNNTHTYEVWFKLLGTPPGSSDGYFFGRQGFHEGFGHYKANPNIVFIITWYNDNRAVGLSYTGALNTWYHGVYTVNVENLTRKLYINGSLVDSGSLLNPSIQTSFVVGAGTTLSSTNHGLSVNQGIYFTSTGTLPSPLSSGVMYFVTSVTSNTFSVSSTSGGTSITFTNSGTGTHYFTLAPLKQYTSPYYLGAASSSYAGNCIVSSAKAYNKELSAAEILQNFTATRKTYGV